MKLPSDTQVDAVETAVDGDVQAGDIDLSEMLVGLECAMRPRHQATPYDRKGSFPGQSGINAAVGGAGVHQRIDGGLRQLDTPGIRFEVWIETYANRQCRPLDDKGMRVRKPCLYLSHRAPMREGRTEVRQPV